MTDEVLTREQSALVRKNVDLAHHLAREVWKKNPDGIDLEEAVSVAYQGLIRAALKFDPERMSPETVASGKAFAAWARRWINGAVLEWQRGEDHVQRSYRQIYKQLQACGYTGKNLDDIAPQMDEPLTKLQVVVHAVENPYVSLDETVSPGVPHPRYGEVAGEHDVESSALEVSITTAVQAAHREMSQQKQLIIAMRYYANLEFQVIAMEMNVSLHYVRELHAEAIEDLHSAMISRVRETH